MRITIIAVSAPVLHQLTLFQKEFQEKYGEKKIEFSMFYVAKAGIEVLGKKEQMIEALTKADVAVVDVMGASEALQDIVREGLSNCKGERIVIGNACRDLIRLGTFSMEGMQKAKKQEEKKEQQTEKKHSPAKMMHMMRRMAIMMGSVVPFGMMKDMKNVFLLIDYWQQAEKEDVYSFMYLILRNYFGMKELPKEKPCSMRYGIYLKNPDTKACTDSLKSYCSSNDFQKERKSIAVLFYGHRYPNDFLPVVQALCKKLEKKYNILPIAFSQNEDKDLKKLEEYLCNTSYPISAVVNLMPFRLGAGPMGGDAKSAVKVLEKLNVPYFKPFCLTKVERQEWEYESAVNPGEFLISILLPELDGGIHTYPIGIMEKVSYDNQEQLEITRIIPMEERISTLVKRIHRFIHLQEMKNEDKKVAIICYNYPPGEDNLFGGAFLDTFASVSSILKDLQKSGYKTNPMTSEELREIFCGDGMCSEPQWADEATMSYFYEKNGVSYPIHGIQNGNVFIGLQPVRRWNEEMDEKTYHDKNIAPSEEYQAFYLWLQENFKADAMLHIGTHGTLEFLPGKENGMMQNCWPDRLVGEIPHFYFYYVGNPSEAMVAKRRSHGVLISYEPPEFIESGVYGEYQEVKNMIAGYRESTQSAPEKCEDILKNIEKVANKCGILKAEEKLSQGTLDVLDERLYQYESSLIPNGLHIIGQGKGGEKNGEIAGMLRALQGEYLPVGIGGDILRNPDIMPTGRNLVQFDPRLVPTRTAYERGMEVARQTMEHYYEEHGTYPESTAVILWGLETSKTQGETIGQILYYLGIRMKQFEGSFDTRFEIIPTDELERPRVDVIIHICGFFRDMFPNLIENFNEIFHKLSLLNETDEQSGFAKNTRKNLEKLLEQGYAQKEAEELSRSRIFGPKEGEYGTRITQKVHKGAWQEAAELGQAFTEDLSYVYSSSKRGVKTSGLLKMNYETVQVISQVRNNVEYELTDLDHYYEFYGGLSKAVENVTGSKAELYISDTTGEKVKTQDLEDALEKGIRTRLLNPKWIDGMMKHEYHGVQQISRRFENVMGFAASTDKVKSQIFSDMEKCYVENETLREAMQQSNCWAYASMMERLMEANNRGYWDATEEELNEVRKAYLEAEGTIER